MSLDHPPADDLTATDRRPSRSMAALCGVLAGALGLGVAELIAGLRAGGAVAGAVDRRAADLAPAAQRQAARGRPVRHGRQGGAQRGGGDWRARPVRGDRAAGATLAGRRPYCFRGAGPVRAAGRRAGSTVRPGAGDGDRGGSHRRQRLVAGLAAAPGHPAQRTGGADDGLRAPALPGRRRGRGGCGGHQRADRPDAPQPAGIRSRRGAAHPTAPGQPPRRCRRAPSWRSTASPRWSCPMAASTGSTPACSPRAWMPRAGR